MLLSREKDANFLSNINNYCSEIVNIVQRNVLDALKSKYVSSHQGMFSDNNFLQMFTLTGAIKVSNIEDIGEAKYYFYNEDGRMTCQDSNNKNCILRGRRYLAAIDSRLSIPQKLKIFYTDIYEGIELLRYLLKCDKNKQYKICAPILDYIKNGVLTLTNAFIQPEKMGDIKLDDLNYQRVRRDLIESGSYVTHMFYLSLLNRIDIYTEYSQEFNKLESTIEEVRNILERQYKDNILSSRAIVRPEASHPIRMLGFTALILDRIRNVDTVVGLPSGGTELAYIVSKAIANEGKTECDLVLVPVSLHSLQVQYGLDCKSDISNYLEKYKEIILDRNLLIVDDNSSSGNTVNTVYNCIKAYAPTSNIHVSVMEADIHRTLIDANNMKKRQHYADISIYKNAIGILPVSKKHWVKHDLKEVIETYSLAKYFKRIAKKADSLKVRIKYEVFHKDAKEPFYRLAPKYDTMPKIDTFQGTFLSNFAPARIVYEGKTFPTVEHAYQFSKFESQIFENLPSTVIEDIQYILTTSKCKPVKNICSIFTDDEVPPGTIKKVSEVLAKKGFVTERWDQLRVDILIGLLCKKFEIPSMMEALKATEGMYLTEGNTWNDTFWGVCNGRGRNMLGLILMNIRQKILDREF